MDDVQARTLLVPGATLYYEVRGSGPILLLIPGGNGDGDAYQSLATQLAERYAVITYDRRGFSRSLLDDPPADPERRLAADVDDAARLLAQVADGPSYVFGSSSGGIVALELLAERPERIQTLIAHEPPLVTLLPDAAQQLTFLDGVYATYRRLGVDSAMKEFFIGAGLGSRPTPAPSLPASPPVAEVLSRAKINRAFWLEYELRQYPRVAPKMAALQAVRSRLVLAGGSDSREYFPYRPNTLLAERLGVELVDFPGGHVGYSTHPSEFAKQMVSVLDRRSGWHGTGMQP